MEEATKLWARCYARHHCKLSCDRLPANIGCRAPFKYGRQQSGSEDSGGPKGVNWETGGMTRSSRYLSRLPQAVLRLKSLASSLYSIPSSAVAIFPEYS